MDRLRIYDSEGNSIHFFTQWDYGQKVYINLLDGTATPEIHFTTNDSEEIIVVMPKIVDTNKISVEVPNSLLLSPSYLFIYLYETSEDGKKTLTAGKFAIRERKKPSDYIFPGNESVVATIGLPEVTIPDNGKILQVINGAWMTTNNVLVSMKSEYPPTDDDDFANKYYVDEVAAKTKEHSVNSFATGNINYLMPYKIIGLTSNGETISSEKRISTPNAVSFARQLTVNARDGYSYSIYYYDGETLSSRSEQQKGEITIPANQLFKIMVMSENESGMQELTSIDELLDCVTIMPESDDIVFIREKAETVAGQTDAMKAYAESAKTSSDNASASSAKAAKNAEIVTSSVDSVKTYATNASNSATQAVNSATQAKTDATTATQKASEANKSATAASSSASAAKVSESNAAKSASEAEQSAKEAMEAITRDVISDTEPSTNRTYSSSKIENMFGEKQDTLTFDTTPASDSQNPVTSDGIYKTIKAVENTLSKKQDKLTLDETPTQGSKNPVTSDGLYSSLAAKINKSDPTMSGTLTSESIGATNKTVITTTSNDAYFGGAGAKTHLRSANISELALEDLFYLPGQTYTEIIPGYGGWEGSAIRVFLTTKRLFLPNSSVNVTGFTTNTTYGTMSTRPLASNKNLSSNIKSYEVLGRNLLNVYIAGSGSAIGQTSEGTQALTGQFSVTFTVS